MKILARCSLSRWIINGELVMKRSVLLKSSPVRLSEHKVAEGFKVGCNETPFFISAHSAPFTRHSVVRVPQRNDVFNRLRSVKSSEVSCDYSLISDPTARSLMSDKYNLIRLFPTLTQPSITTEKSPADQKPSLSVSHDDQTDEIRLSCEIPESESVTADFNCNLYTGENPQLYLHQTSKKRKSGKLHCFFTAQRNDVFNRLRSVKSSEVSCDYSLISDPTARSLMSDKYNLIRLFPTLTQPSITEISPAGFSPTQTQPSITTEKSPAGSEMFLQSKKTFIFFPLQEIKN
ncbi:hypothetical protein QTP86_007701 [Hemibagrus guttatus]|nr:hypothetical protein QTP86_007701 [Hemibagrus guttatus]